ncbi:MAG: acetate/propionate family kinase [bacterium]|nr:acetate/propionate family kinase [bacterium]
MKVLVLNCGSSSVKFQLIETDLQRIDQQEEVVLAQGLVEKIGFSPSILRYQRLNENPLKMPELKDTLPAPDKEPIEVLGHEEAIQYVLKVLTDAERGVVSSPDEIDAVGHRVVHGGERFQTSVLITDEVVEGIHACVEFAPLHNPANLKGYYACKEVLPNCPHVAVFDTAFHQSMPPKAYLYGLPYGIYQKHGIRRYGFHGISHRYVSYRLGQLTGVHRDELRIITCHLGNGCSMTALDHGRSVDTTMGFTPLEGLLMGTRTGDMDPSIILSIAAKEELTWGEANSLMNKHSGLLGISGVSSDMREIEKAAAEGNERAKLALDMFSYRIKKYLGAYAAAMGGVDHVIFTGGIGENSEMVRRDSCLGLGFMGVEVDEQRNKKCVGHEGKISTESSRVGVWAIPTNEELVFARDTVRCIEGVTK